MLKSCSLCRIPFADFILGVDLEDTLTPDTSIVHLLIEDGSVLVPTGLDHGVSVIHDLLLYTFTRTRQNTAVVHVSPVRVPADEVEINSPESRPRLVVACPLLDSRLTWYLVWRSHHERTGRSAEVSCAPVTSGERWSAAVEVAEITDAHEVGTGPFARPTKFTLFAVADDGSQQAVAPTSSCPADCRSRCGMAVVLPRSSRRKGCCGWCFDEV